MILETIWLLKDGKTAQFVFLARGGISPEIAQIAQIAQITGREVFWAINNQFWAISFYIIAHNKPCHICWLPALGNLGNCGRYTPPPEYKTGKFVGNCVGNSTILAKMELPTDEESTTYRGHFFPLFPKTRKSFILNPALQAKNLSPFGQFRSLENESAKGRCL